MTPEELTQLAEKIWRGAQAPGEESPARPLIGICGDTGAGKNTLADLVNTEFPAYAVMRWDAKLREVTSVITGIPAAQMVSEADKEVDLTPRKYAVCDLHSQITAAILSVISEREDYRPSLTDSIYRMLTGHVPWESPGKFLQGHASLSLTVGQLLHKLDAECFRGLMSPGVWVKSLVQMWEDSGRLSAIIVDARSSNALRAVRQAAGVIILVRRATRADSDRALDGELTDFIIDNDSSIEDLRATLLALWPDILALAASRRQ